jgi:S-adenosylmethionine uptake transporter
MAISLLLFFWGLARVPLALGVTLGFISPLVALTLAGLFLGERIARATIAASVIAFCGVLVILSGQPREVTGAGEGWGHCAILAAAILYAVGTVIGRPLAQRAAPIEVALVFNIVAATVYLFGAPWLAALPAATHFPTLLFAATTSGASIMLLAWAYARAETQYLVPVEYTAFLWAALFGWFAFGEPVTPATLAGAILIVAGCLGATRSGARARSAAT